MAQYYNISGESTQELIAAGKNINVSEIHLSNTHIKSTCKVDLYIEKVNTGKFYLAKGVELPVGATLLLNDVSFRNSSGEFGLYIKLTAGDTFTLTGTIDPAASTTVPGVNTLFLSEITIGDQITVSSETKTVSAIASDTSLTVSQAFSNNSNDTTPDCIPQALVDVIIK